MKPEPVHGGQTTGEQTPRERKAEEVKTLAKNKWQQITGNGQLLSIIFTLGVYIIGSIILGMMRHEDFWALIFDPIFRLLSIALFLLWIYYDKIVCKNQLETVKTVLLVMLAILSLMLIAPWGKEKLENFSSHFSTPAAASYSSGYASADYDDSNFLEKGSHEFAFADSGSEIGWIGVKKDIRKWGLDVSKSSQNKLLIIFSDGDTIKSWEGGQKEIWGKQFKMVSLAKMENVVLTLD